MFVLDKNWISSYRSKVSKYYSSTLSNLICGSPGGTVRHQPPSKTCPVRIGTHCNKTIWFTGIATPPYPKVHEKLTNAFFVHVPGVTVPIRRVCQLSRVSSSDTQYIMGRKCTTVQCNVGTCMLFLLKLLNKWEAAVLVRTLGWNPSRSMHYATVLASESLKHLSLSKSYQAIWKKTLSDLTRHCIGFFAWFFVHIKMPFIDIQLLSAGKDRP